MTDLSAATTSPILPRRNALEIRALLSPFAINPEEEAAFRRSFNTPIGNWELHAAERCRNDSQLFKAYQAEVERAILDRYATPQKLEEDLLKEVKQRGRSASEEAHSHFDFSRHGEEAGSRRELREAVAVLASTGRRLMGTLQKMDQDCHSPYLEALGTARTMELLSALGLEAEKLFVDKERQQSVIKISLKGGASEQCTEKIRYKDLEPACLDRIAGYARQAHNLELDRHSLMMALHDTRRFDAGALTAVAEQFGSELDKGAKEAACYVEGLRKLTPFAATREALQEINHLQNSLSGTVYSLHSEFVAALQGLGDFGSTKTLSEKAVALGQQLTEARSLLSREQRRIIKEQTQQAFQELFAGETASAPGGYQTLLKSAVTVAGKRARDYHGTLFEMYRTEIFEALAKAGNVSSTVAKLMRCYKAPQGILELPEFNPGPAEFWGAVAVHAVSIVVTRAVTEELRNIEQEGKIRARAATLPAFN